MARVPQTVIRIIAFNTLDPPVLAAMVPNKIKKTIEKPYKAYSM